MSIFWNTLSFVHIFLSVICLNYCSLLISTLIFPSVASLLSILYILYSQTLYNLQDSKECTRLQNKLDMQTEKLGADRHKHCSTTALHRFKQRGIMSYYCNLITFKLRNCGNKRLEISHILILHRLARQWDEV